MTDDGEVGRRLKRELSESSSSDEGEDSTGVPGSDIEEALLVKQARIDPPQSVENKTFVCALPPQCYSRPKRFDNVVAYESHYNTSHRYQCHECKKCFPSEKFLDLHISELHDPMAATLRDRGEKVLACFVDGCARKFKSSRKRQYHLIQKHHFPENYYFSVVVYGVDRYRFSMILPTRKAKKKDNSKGVVEIVDKMKGIDWNNKES